MRGVAILSLLAACGRIGFATSAGVRDGDTVEPDVIGISRPDAPPPIDADPTIDSPIGFGGYTVTQDTAPYASPAGAQLIPGFAIAADEENFDLALPFPFVFYGIAYTHVTASVNGFLTFGISVTGPDSYSNDCPFDATTPDATIAVFWDDLYAPDASSAMTTATAGAAPDRTFTIEWRGLDAYYHAGAGNNFFGQGARVTQQVVLFENGTIEMRYGPRAPPTTDRDCGLTRHQGCSATVGLESPSNNLTTFVQCGTELGPHAGFVPLVEGALIRFVPN